MTAQPPSNRPSPRGPGAASKTLRDASAKPVQHRLLVPLAAVLLVVVGGFVALLMNLHQGNLVQASQWTLAEASDELSETLAEQSDTLDALEEVLLRDAGLRNALKRQDRQALLAACADVFAQLRTEHGITQFYFHRPDRVNLLRVHKPEETGGLIDRFSACEAEQTGKTASGLELGPLCTFTLRVVRPVFDGHTLIGYLELGKEIEDILADTHDELGVELAVTVHKNALNREKWESGMAMLGRDSNWDRFHDAVLIYASLPRFPAEAGRSVCEAGHKHGDATAEAAFGGRMWRVLVTPLNDVSGAEVGDLLVFHDVSEAVARFNRLVGVASGAALVLLAALIGFLYVALRRVDRGILAREADLARSERFQRTLTETSPDFIFILDRDMTIRAVNRVQPGHREEDVVGRSAPSFVPAEQQDNLREAFGQALETRELQAMETTVHLPDGEHFFLNRLNPLPGVEEERAVVLIATDITERKRAEDAAAARTTELQQQTVELEKSRRVAMGMMEDAEQARRVAEAAREELCDHEERLQTILNTIQAGVVVIEEEGHTIVDANPAALVMIGAPEEEVVGRVCHKYICPAEVGRCPISDLGQEVDRSERALVKADGETIPVLKTVTPVMLNGRRHLLESFVDITNRKQAEEELRESNAMMVDALEREKQATMELEATTDELRESLDDLERFNRMATGRELRMVELKEEVNTLLLQLGKQPTYRTDFDNADIVAGRADTGTQ